MPPRDPKDIITPYAFRVEPRLLGIPLATPFRRGMAMLVDLLLLVLLLAVRQISWILLGLVGAWVLFRVSSPRADEGVSGPVARPTVRAAAVLLFLFTVIFLMGSCVLGIFGGGGDRRGAAEAPWRDAVLATSLARADSAVATTARGTPAPGAPATDTSPGAATDTVPETGPEVGREDEVAALLRDLRRAQREAERARARAEQPTPGLLAFLGSIANDLGLGIGWAGIYFTLFLVLLGGRTPGKRLLGIRVVRLTGEPIGWWTAFARFGGYAAGLATGLIGFLQIYWDANRQGIHDKVVGTVVIRDGAPSVRGGKAPAPTPPP